MKRNVSLDGPDPVDLHVGARLRERRVSLGLSQEGLARRLGLTFQQVQKYEKGANRVSASTLWHAAEALDCPVALFFDGLGDPAAAASADSGREVLMIARTLAAIESPTLRRAASRIVRDLWAVDTKVELAIAQAQPAPGAAPERVA